VVCVPGGAAHNMSALKQFNVRTASAIRMLGAYAARERQFVQNEVLKVKGLMPLLMKPRNRQRWSAEDKAELAVHLKRLSGLSPYLMVIVMPGGFLLLPVLAWWIDRRRKRRGSQPDA
jgi:hypothetical protein